MSMTQTQQQNVPTLRFPEFSGEWKPSKLKDFSEVKRGAGSQYIKYSTKADGGLRLVRIGDFLGSEPVYVEPTKSIKRFVLAQGDILIAGTGATAGITFSIPDEFVGLAYSYNAPRIRQSSNSSDFLINYLKSPYLEKQRARLFTGNAQPFLDTTDIRNFKFGIPSLPEQQKIASFLSSVDSRIAQLGEKKALLQLYKKGMMQKLFSQTLRFKDKDGNDFPDWQEKRLGDLYEFKSTNSLSRDKLNYDGGEVRNIHYGDIHTKFNSAFDLSRELVPFINSDVDLSRISEDKYCHKGDLVIADASEDYDDIGKTIELINLNDEKVLAGLHTLLARLTSKDIHIGFGTFVMACAPVRKQIKIIAQGTKVLGISTRRMAKIKLPTPCPEEQQKITAFLSAIDQKIDLVSNELTHAKAFKKGLLQQMFV